RRRPSRFAPETSSPAALRSLSRLPGATAIELEALALVAPHDLLDRGRLLAEQAAGEPGLRARLAVHRARARRVVVLRGPLLAPRSSRRRRLAVARLARSVRVGLLRVVTRRIGRLRGVSRAARRPRARL